MSYTRIKVDDVHRCHRCDRDLAAGEIVRCVAFPQKVLCSDCFGLPAMVAAADHEIAEREAAYAPMQRLVASALSAHATTHASITDRDATSEERHAALAAYHRTAYELARARDAHDTALGHLLNARKKRACHHYATHSMLAALLHEVEQESAT